MKVVDRPIINNSQNISLPQELLIFMGLMELFGVVSPTLKNSAITTIFEKKMNNSILSGLTHSSCFKSNFWYKSSWTVQLSLLGAAQNNPDRYFHLQLLPIPLTLLSIYDLASSICYLVVHATCVHTSTRPLPLNSFLLLPLW